MKSYKQYYLDQHKLREPIKKYQQNNPQIRNLPCKYSQKSTINTRKY